jgi:SAM-dependent methyltransferase
MKYIGTELELFKLAYNWKKYWKSFIVDFAKGDILDVGFGMGSNIDIVFNNEISQYVGLEPDLNLLQLYRSNIHKTKINRVNLINGTLLSLKKDTYFDLIMYIDVLEHILDDYEEIERAAKHLKPGGSIFILAPAHNFLYSYFDDEVGHYRRYNKRIADNLFQYISPAMVESKLIYLDSLGALASLMNRFILRQKKIKISQIIFWDKILIPLSRVVDFITNYSVGKSILMIYTKK